MERAIRSLLALGVEGVVLWIHFAYVWEMLTSLPYGTWTILQLVVPLVLPPLITALLRFPDRLWPAIGMAAAHIPLFLILLQLAHFRAHNLGEAFIVIFIILPTMTVLWLLAPLLVRLLQRKGGT